MAVAVLMVHALVLPPLTPYRCVKVGNDRTGTPVAGLFDMFKESDEAKAAKEEAFKAQQEMLARRRNPEAMEQYLSEVDQRRAETSAADAELKALQRGSAAGDKLEEWKKLRKDGKVLGADDSERDADSSRLGSDGLIAERIDEKLPYIDDGYVDDSAPDLMKGLGKLFGGK